MVNKIKKTKSLLNMDCLGNCEGKAKKTSD